MGNNIDLVSMLGLPEKLECPVCKSNIAHFEDYDIECGDPFKKGSFVLDCYCNECDLSFNYRGVIEFKDIELVKGW